MRGRKPIPRPGTLARTALGALPRCPAHLDAVARKEWRRLATPLHAAGILTLADRAALAAYCQAWSRWVAAEAQLAQTPPLLKTPSGYVQQSPWLSVANKQLEIMGRYMAELGLTPAARSRRALSEAGTGGAAGAVRMVLAWQDDDGVLHETPLARDAERPAAPAEEITTILLDPRL